MDKNLEAAKLYLHGASTVSVRRRYFHALISVTAWNSKNELILWSGIGRYSDKALWNKPFNWWKKVITGHVRNRHTFLAGFMRAKMYWPDLWLAIEKNDREAIVKLRVGLGYKGASVLLRDSGKMSVPLDTHILQKVFGLTPKEALKVQSKGKDYIHYEERFIAKYGARSPLMDLVILAGEIGHKTVEDFARLAWRV